MNRVLPGFIQERMKLEGIGRREVVLRMGYKNMSKGFRRLDEYLRGEKLPNEDQTERLSRALNVLYGQLDRYVRRDLETIQEEEDWKRAQDPNYYIYYRFFLVMTLEPPVTEDQTEDQALDEARMYSIKNQIHCCLSTPENIYYCFTPEGRLKGTINGGPAPSLTVKGRVITLKIED